MERPTQPACPPESALEALANGAGAPAGAAEHADRCPRCRERVEDIRENNRFLAGVRARGGAPPDALPADFVPGYHLLGEVHRGGQGVVLKAIQAQTRRRVAIKLLYPGRASSDRQRARFEQEVALAASLRHPGIVVVLDCVRPRDGRLGYAMEYIRGRPLDDWARGLGAPSAPSLREKLRLFLSVCDAVQYAHRRGVIHRDLKPANVIVGSDDAPHLCDFGVAKALGDAGQTATGEFVGTLAYASPEQVAGRPDDIDTRCDVYSLGVMLYELVVGDLPHAIDAPLPVVAQRIRSEAPRRPSSRGVRVSADLETVILKALAKEPDRRYQSPQRLAEDLRRYLDGDAIEARRSSGWYVLRKSARRHWPAISVAAAFVLLLAAFGVASRLQAGRLRNALEEANLERARALVGLGSVPAAERALWSALFADRGPARWDPRRPGPTASRAWWALREMYAANPCRITARAGEHRVSAILPLPGHPHLAVVTDAGGSISVRDLRTLAPALTAEGAPLSRAAPAGILQAALTPDLRLVTWGDDGAMRQFDALSLRDLGPPVTLGAGVLRGCFGDGGRAVLLVGDESLRVLSTGADDFGAERASVPHGEDGEPSAQAFEGRTLVRARAGGLAFRELPPADTPDRLVPLPPGDRVAALTLSPDGATVFFRLAGQVRVLAAGDERPRVVAAPEHVQHVHAIALSPDGARLAVACDDRRLSVWSTAAPAGAGPATQLSGHSGALSQLAFTHDGAALLSGDHSGVVKRWDLASPGLNQAVRPLVGHEGSVLGVAVGAARGPGSPARGAVVYTASADGTVAAWDAESGALRARSPDLGGQVHAVALSPDGLTVAAAVRVEHAGGIRGDIVLLTDALTRPRLIAAAHADRCADLAFSPDGRVLASGGDDDHVRTWDPASGARLGERATPWMSQTARCDVRSVRFSPDSRRLVWAGYHGLIRVGDAALRAPDRALSGFEQATIHSAVRVARFSPDGRRIAATGNEPDIRLWDAATGRPQRRPLRGHTGTVFGLDFDSRGTLVASCGADGTVRLWDARRGHNLAVLRDDTPYAHLPDPPEGRQYFAVAFTPDAERLVVAGGSGYLGLWDLLAFEPHIAGNLEHWADALQPDGPRAPERLRRWARQHSAPSGGSE